MSQEKLWSHSNSLQSGCTPLTVHRTCYLVHRVLKRLLKVLRGQDEDLADRAEAWIRQIEGESDAMLDFLTAHMKYRTAECNVVLLAAGDPEYEAPGAQNNVKPIKLAAEQVLGQVDGVHKQGLVPFKPRRSDIGERRKAAQSGLAVARKARRKAADTVIKTRREIDAAWVTEVRAALYRKLAHAHSLDTELRV